MSEETADPKQIEQINQMSRIEMAEMWRYAPVGHPWFDSRKPYYEVFKTRFDALGRFSPEISKAIDGGR